MKTSTLLITAVAALGVVGAATAAVNTCATPKKPVHHVAAYHARSTIATRRVHVLANAAAPSYAETAPPPVMREREYVAAAYPPPPVYEGAYYGPGPVIYGGPYWGPGWGYRGYWHGGWGRGFHGRWR